VGKRGWYKDFETVVRALAKTNDVRLVVVGGGQLEPKFDRLIAELGLANRIRVVPNPSEDRLARILRSSCGLISASREEGFGLPALEALSLGVPALLTDIAAYRELFSRWADLYPVGDFTTLATLMERTVARPPPPVPAEVLATAFSWDRAAAATEAAYAAAAGSD
jgi:glycosyltransferase involved in cell wall biosynthesis